MREDIEFDADGVTLRGWLYSPEAVGGAAPTVVMAHGFSAVKEMYLDRFAEEFAGAGLAALVFDNRNFGASDGEPRQEIDPWEQIRDYRTAITYAATRPDVDPDRIGIWGSSYSGRHVLAVAAIDRRVKCVVAQVPAGEPAWLLGHGLPSLERDVQQNGHDEHDSGQQPGIAVPARVLAGPRLAPNPLPLAGVQAKVRTASGRMPVYSATVLKDSEIADIVASHTAHEMSPAPISRAS